MFSESQKERRRSASRAWKARNPEKVRKNHRDWYRKNFKKIQAKARAKYKANPEEEKARRRISYGRSPHQKVARMEAGLKAYGISLKQFIDMAVSQKACCAICGNQERLFVDHSHTSEKVRGLLCAKCNFGIGHFNDSPKTLLRAVAYLERTN